VRPSRPVTWPRKQFVFSVHWRRPGGLLTLAFCFLADGDLDRPASGSAVNSAQRAL
jgi:hypothetical protein